MDRDELLHRAVQFGERSLYRVESAPCVEFAAKRVAQVVHAPAGTMRHFERAAARTAECTAGMGVGAGRRCEIARASSRVRERSELVFVEQISGHAGAAVSAVVGATRPRLTRCARSARRDRVQFGGNRELSFADGASKRALFVLNVPGPLVTESPPQRDELVRPRSGLANPD